MAIWKKVVIFAIGLISLGFIWFVLSVLAPNKQKQVCKDIIFTVSDYDKFQFISEKDIQLQLENANISPVNKMRDEVDLSVMEMKLQEMNMVKKSVCYFAVDGSLCVSVQQRVPLFRIKTTYDDYYIDSERNRMPTSLKFTAHVPIITGSVKQDFAKNELYDFIKYIENSRQWTNMFTQIIVLPDNRVELVPRIGNFIISMGELENFEGKLKKLHTFYNKAGDFYGGDKYYRVSLEFKDQVVCSKR
ncbi:MAG: hypothetical protein R3Y59_03865 [bacterium]